MKPETGLAASAEAELKAAAASSPARLGRNLRIEERKLIES
jgi:hypothetical protein